MEALNIDSAEAEMFLKLVTTEQAPEDIKLQALIFLKNCVKSTVGDHNMSTYSKKVTEEEEGQKRISAAGIEIIKQNVVQAATQGISIKMRKQLQEIIALIAKEYLYKNWTGLIPMLMQILDQS